MVEKEAHVSHAKEPCAGRTTGPVKDGVCHLLDHLIATLHGILVLLTRLILPGGDEERAQDVQDLAPNFDLSSITDELGGGTANVVL